MFNFFLFFDLNSMAIMIKIIFLIFIFMAVVFMAIVFKQVLSLNTIVDDKNDSFILKEIALILLLLCVSLFLTAIVIL